MLRPKIDVTAYYNQLLCDGGIHSLGRQVQRRAIEPILCLKVDVTSRDKKLLCNGLMAVGGGQAERCGAILCRKVHVTPRINELRRMRTRIL
jgi:hypothetical protein